MDTEYGSGAAALPNGRRITEERTSPSSFDSLVGFVGRTLRARTVGLYLTDAHDELHLQSGAPREYRRLSDQSALRDLLASVLRTSAPVATAARREHPGGREPEANADAGEISFAGVPVPNSAGGVAGVLCVGDEPTRSWSPEEFDLLTRAASEIGDLLPTALARAPELTGASQDGAVLRMLQVNPLPMWIFDLETLRFLAVNDAAVQHYGYSHEEFLSRTLHDIRPPETIPHLVAALQSAPDGFLRLPLTHQKRDGTIIDVEVTHAPIRFAGREARLMLALDNTEQRRAVERSRFLADASSLLTTTLDYTTRLANLARLSVPRLGDFCIVDIVEDDGRVCRLEAAHADPEQESLVRELLRFPPIEKRPGGVSKALQTGQSVLLSEIDEGARQLLAQNPEHLEVIRKLGPRSSLTVPLVVRGHAVGAISFVMAHSARRYHPHDVELAEEVARRAAIALDNARLYQRAQQAIRAREEVLGVVSHELRNPLNATLLTLEMLLEYGSQEIPEAQRKKLESIRRFSDQMVRLVDDLVDVARVEAGQLPIRPERLECALAVEEAMQAVQPFAESKSVQLDVQLPDTLPAIFADRQRVLQVFGNLLANAIRQVRPMGTVRIRAESDGKEIRFSVEDTGPGIPEERLKSLFDGSRPRAQGSDSGGTLGMGLAIASGIVRAHGGQIWANSRVGEGSTFVFTLPVASHPASESRWQDEQRPVPSIPLFATVDAQARADVKDASRSRGQEDGARKAAFLDELSRSAPESAALAFVDSAGLLRGRILAALHLGHLQPGDRLPSIREIASAFGISKNTAVRVFDQLALEGVIEKRDRSGAYVGDLGRPEGKLLMETAEWLAGVLAEACEHQLRIPNLPQLIRRWTGAVRLRCACVESDQDSLIALCAEYSHQFGLECVPVPADALSALLTDPAGDPRRLPEELRSADLLLTTAFHAPALRAAAELLRKPLVVTTADPEVVATVDRRIQDGEIILVCVDPRFGERVRALRESLVRDRVRVVLAGDAEALAQLDPAEPVLLTRAAREQIGEVNFRLLVPRYPAFSHEASREVSRLLVQLNLEAERRVRAAGS
ncbi:MAG: GAF domain-containing protein [Gemmatimonadetes bacterium]|nr:GAF domain-containing protein [Gemmatimonadota bacterium]